MITKPKESYGSLDGYIGEVDDHELIVAMVKYSKDARSYLESIPQSRWDFAYAQGKWTVKELVLHLIDSERIFAYRALRLCRLDKTPLAGFDEDFFVQNSFAGGRSAQSLLQEYNAVRMATHELFSNMDPQAALHHGEANGRSICAAALGFAILGHERHHIRILKERYFPTAF